MSPQLAGTHVLAWQTRLMQSAPFKHWTHAPAPLHSAPPPSAHGAPLGKNAFIGVPALHVSFVHALMSSRTSPLSLTVFSTPEAVALHLLAVAGVCVGVGMPIGWLQTPQTPPSHVRVSTPCRRRGTRWAPSTSAARPPIPPGRRAAAHPAGSPPMPPGRRGRRARMGGHPASAPDPLLDLASIDRSR
jgi:hypothetical protein